MATLNRFQQYSQPENVVTNNILLMLSNLYDINPRYYDEMISSLVEDTNFYSVIPNFRQQVGNSGNGIIDGHIVMKRSSIIIETKLYTLESIDKLIKYTDSFKSDDAKILFHLSREKYDAITINQIKQLIEEKHPQMEIKFYSISFNQLVDDLKAMSNIYSYDGALNNLANDFEEYCSSNDLLFQKNILRAMACGQSFDLNIKHQFYFDLASRGYSRFNYLGIYYWKAVRYIGRVENIIVADYDYDIEELIIKWSEKEVTLEQRERLIAAIKEADDLGWGISENHRFFLLNDFHETNFVKNSPGGIFRVRYFNLEFYLGKNISNDLRKIAEELKRYIWESPNLID